MKFKIDENLPVEIAELLIKSGHNAKTVKEQQLKGAKDSVLINLCKKENRALVTLDIDFSDITAYPPAGRICRNYCSESKKPIQGPRSRRLPTCNTDNRF